MGIWWDGSGLFSLDSECNNTHNYMIIYLHHGMWMCDIAFARPFRVGCAGNIHNNEEINAIKYLTNNITKSH